MKKEQTYTFNSIMEFAGAVETLETTGTQFSKEKESRDPNRDKAWDHGLGFKGALKMGLNGGNWTKGARDLLRAELGNDGKSDSTMPVISTDLAGFCPCVPNTLAGVPDAMFVMDTMPKPRTVIRMAVEVARPWFIKAHEAMNQGRALLSLIDSMETNGISVELYATRCSGKGERTKAKIEVCIKRAGEFWSAESAAFALCHPAFSRRLIWRFEEGTKALAHIPDNSYGNSLGATPEGYDIYIPYQMRDQQEHCQSGEEALAFYTDMIQTQLG